MEQPTTNPINTKLQLMTDILERIANGEIRVPIFQRDFLWDRNRVKELLSSICKGYPIGSIILWQTSDRSFKAKISDDIPFPDFPVDYPTTFIIDGVQRLSSLYGVLITPKTDELGKKFNLYYDLGSEEFFFTSRKKLEPFWIRLSHVVSYKHYSAAQRFLFEQEDGELLTDRLTQLYLTIKRYEIPVVTITERPISEVTDIFLKLNTQGKNLTKGDLQEAEEWKEKYESAGK